MNKTIAVLYQDCLGESDLNVLKIIAFFGGTVRSIQLPSGQFTNLEEFLTLQSQGVICSASTLINLQTAYQAAGKQFRLADLGEHVFVHGFAPGLADERLLQQLTEGALTSVERSAAASATIDVANEPICRQLAGISFGLPGISDLTSFVQGSDQPGCSQLICAGRKPVVVRLKRHGSDALLVAGSEIADLDLVLTPGKSLLDSFAGLAPLLMFLRETLQEYIWHNDAPTACFIVDDPLLKRRYGCLDYDKLLDCMDRKGFTTSIAFIPWNYKRSQKEVVDVFASRTGSYSLCVHGCDHTGGEFGSSDPVSLRRKSQQSLQRMNDHRRLSGLDFDDVMVFPQGIFSTAAMGALKFSGFLGAVNSSPFPVNTDDRLTLRDVLQVAITRYSNFPLFLRWYPHQFAELAFNVFLGKPALLVEHHHFFREGYGALAETIDRVNNLMPKVRWSNLSTICSTTSLRKLDDNGDPQVMFFTDRFSMRNETDSPKEYRLFRQGSYGPDTVVTVNGQRMDVHLDETGLEVRSSLSAGEWAQLRIETKQESLSPGLRPQLMYQAGVFMRRSLSEFRDNYLHNSRFGRAAGER